MDYKTKPLGRNDIRIIARMIRKTFKCKNKYRFDVIGAFEQIHFKFPQITTEIVETDSQDVIFNLDVPAVCKPDMNGNYHIVVRENVYEGACCGVGGYRAHIMHEMCHAVLCIMGFTPILDRVFNNNEIMPRYTSMEWQAKALTGEVMVPYKETIGFSQRKIKYLCQVSDQLADYRVGLDSY